jgi:hypothetical protein
MSMAVAVSVGAVPVVHELPIIHPLERFEPATDNYMVRGTANSEEADEVAPRRV